MVDSAWWAKLLNSQQPGNKETAAGLGSQCSPKVLLPKIYFFQVHSCLQGFQHFPTVSPAGDQDFNPQVCVGSYRSSHKNTTGENPAHPTKSGWMTSVDSKLLQLLQEGCCRRRQLRLHGETEAISDFRASP